MVGRESESLGTLMEDCCADRLRMTLRSGVHGWHGTVDELGLFWARHVSTWFTC